MELRREEPQRPHFSHLRSKLFSSIQHTENYSVTTPRKSQAESSCRSNYTPRFFGKPRPQSAQNTCKNSPRHLTIGPSVFNLPLREALYCCTSGMSCVLNACESYIESIDLEVLLVAKETTQAVPMSRTIPLSSSADEAESPHLAACGVKQCEPLNSMGDVKIIRQSVAGFILDVGTLKRLHVEEPCQAVLTILATTAIPHQPASRLNVLAAAAAERAPLDSGPAWGLVAAKLMLVHLRKVIVAIQKASEDVHSTTSKSPQQQPQETPPREPQPIQSGRSVSGRLPQSSKEGHVPLWSRRPSSAAVQSALRPSAPNFARRTSTTNANIPRQLTNLRNEIAALRENMAVLQRLVDSIAERRLETKWIPQHFEPQPIPQPVDEELKANVAFVTDVDRSLFPKLRLWEPNNSKIGVVVNDRPPTSSGGQSLPNQPQRPALRSRPISGGYRHFRQIPIAGEGHTTQPVGSQPVVKTAPLTQIMDLDDKNWCTLTKGGAVSLRQLIDNDAVPWPTNCLLRICDELGLPRDYVLHKTPQSVRPVAATTLPRGQLELIDSYLKVLQRRWHPDRFHQALGGAHINQPNDGDDVCEATERTLAHSTWHAQSINALRDVLRQRI